MVVLAEERPGDEFPPEKVAKSRRRLQLLYGMPIDWRPVELGASLPACRAVVATRLQAPDREPALPAAAAGAHLHGLALDDPEVIERAATEALIEPEEIRTWLRTRRSSRCCGPTWRPRARPSPASRAQDYKLGGPAEERRYTCPSYELIRVTEPPEDWPTANRVDLPGYRPIEAYETAIANLAPELTREPDPESVEQVLMWAGMPIATAEVAAVCDREVADVRAELARVATLPAGRRRRLLAAAAEPDRGSLRVGC